MKDGTHEIEANTEVAGRSEFALLDCRPSQDFLREMENCETADELKTLHNEYKEGAGKIDARRKFLEDEIERMNKELLDIMRDHFCMVDIEGAIAHAIGCIELKVQRHRQAI